MDTASAAPIKLQGLPSVADAVTARPYTTKAPGQQGETALDVMLNPRVVTAKAVLQTADHDTLWDLRADIAKAFAQQPVRFGESLVMGTLTLQRAGYSDREIDAIAQSIETQRMSAAGMGRLDAEWYCPYPWWRDVADSRHEAGPAEGLSMRSLTSTGNPGDSSNYPTSSVTLKAGRLYLLAVSNTKATTPDTATITGGGTWIAQHTLTFNTAATPTQRLSIFKLVPTADYTGTLGISFSATQTACLWDLTEVFGADVSRADIGVRQSVVARFDSTAAPVATLAALLNADSGVYGATAKGSTSAVTPGSGFTELTDVTEATPAAGLQTEWRNGNDTTVDCSWTGAVAAETIALEIIPLTFATNAGDVDAPFVALLYGPATVVTLTNDTTGEAFTLTVTLASGDFVTVDTTPGQKSIKKTISSVETSAWDTLSLTSPRLFSLRPGVNGITYTVTGVGVGTRAELAWRNRYGGVR